MATNKTINPTNVTVQIPAMADKPNQATNSNCMDKIIDGVNAVNGNIANFQTHEGYVATASTWDGAIEEWVDSLPSTRKMHIGFVQRTGQGIRMAIAQKIDSNYASAIGFGYWASNVTYYKKDGGTWTAESLALNSKIDTYIFNKTYSVTTSSTGAVSVETADKPHRFVGALLTSGGPGFVFRRDESYFTVFNNSMQPLADTAVTFIAYFAQYVG